MSAAEVPAPHRPTAVRTATTTYTTQLAVAVLSLGNVLVVSRALGPVGRGSVALLTTIAVIANYTSTLGVQEANANLGSSSGHLRPTLATNSLVLSVLFGGGAAAVLGALAFSFPEITAHAGHELTFFVLASVPIQVFAGYLARLVQSEYRFALSNAAWLCAPLTNLSVNGMLDVLGRLTVTTAVATWVAGQTLGMLLLAAGVARAPGFGRPSRALAGRSVRFGLKVHGGTVMLFGNYRLDQWLLGALAGERQLGLYSVAVSWAESLFFLPTVLSLVQRPDLVRAGPSEAARQATKGFRIAVLATIPLAAGMIAFAPLLCVKVFGESFRGSVPDLRWLTLGAFGIVALKLLGNALTAQQMPLRQTVAIGVAFAVTIALDLLLIPAHGGIGAAIASSVAYTAGGVTAVVLFVRGIGTKPGELIPRRGDTSWLLTKMSSRVSSGRTSPS